VAFQSWLSGCWRRGPQASAPRCIPFAPGNS